MIEAEITVELEMMEGERERLREQFFERLLEQSIRNEKHQVDQESLLLEMYLSYIYFKKTTSDQMFKEFIQFIMDETHQHIEAILQQGCLKRRDNLRRSIFRYISNQMKDLYILLRDSLILSQQSFSEKYNYMLKKNHWTL